MEQIKLSLQSHLENEILELKELERGSDQRSQAVDEIHRLSGLIIESTKVDNEEIREEKIRKSTKWDRIVKTATDWGQIVIPVVASTVVFALCMKFEEEGNLKSAASKTLIGKAKFTK